MNPYIPVTLLALFTVFTSYSQKKEKIRGSRNVTSIITEIDPFERLVIGDDFKIKLMQGPNNAVQIDADDNLHQVIEFEVQGGSLKFDTTKRIRSHKQLDITVIFKDSLNSIELKGEAELSSMAPLHLNNITLVTKESSKAYLTLKADLFRLVNSNKSDIELNVTANKASLELNDNSDIEALINASEINVDLYQRATARIDGDTDKLLVRADNSTTFKGEKLTAKNTTLITEGRAKVSIETKSTLSIEASGDSETYLFGSPKIEIIKFEDRAALLKK
ncbi:DUF2807 domain-containing protein [Bizionia gelidisalsuginis]|uniref:DUF2807 domain-containing protein n=2 Tax=Bizionia TaxID=283785 RepID=A0A8H2LP17_9FLAO|nr:MULTISPECIES: DUF2807 domain-containing protein [Bizionia]TYB77497.1 DUF2807 domain-containing protein [Bizionia saleffrena]TYC17822.1 DUF2807 domain-containing protein [Bizionia gelidisalsuginis]